MNTYAATTPFFDELSCGFEIVLVKGPLTPVHLMRWSAAIENWHRIHYDRSLATEHDGLPDLLINGSLKQQFVVQLLKDWAGPDGWVWRVAFQFRGMNMVGETLRIWARIRELRPAQGLGLVYMDIGITNFKGAESTPGSAVIALPFRDGPSIPYPFVAPPSS